MKVFVIVSGNGAYISPFVLEQMESLKKIGVEFELYSVIGKGIIGYLKNIIPIRNKIRNYHPDLIHAHYGLSGFLALLSKPRSLPQITTFHGNDINSISPHKWVRPNWNKFISRIVYNLSRFSIFVSDEIAIQIDKNFKKSEIIPCQVNLDTFYPIDKQVARKAMDLPLSGSYVLFSSSFDTYIKNATLAKQVCKRIIGIELIELKGYTREEVNHLMNACDVALITSFNEGSNQFLKEAMACNRPLVSTRVGDAEWIFGNTEGCFLTSFNPEDVAEKLRLALEFNTDIGQTKGRNRMIELRLDAASIANRIYGVYKKVLEVNTHN